MCSLGTRQPTLDVNMDGVVVVAVLSSAHYYLYMSHIQHKYTYISDESFFSVVRNRAFVCLVFVLCLSFRSIFLACI